MTIKLKPIGNQVVVVTGGDTGIGLATARAAARAGAKVVLVARDEAALGAVVRDINNAGGRADYAVADLANASALAAAGRAAVARFGRVDTWVNDAGEAAGDRPFEARYIAVVNGCLAAEPLLRREGGALVTVAATATDAAFGHAVRGYVEALRLELLQRAPAVAVSLVVPAVDDPGLVADAILACAVRPRREVVVDRAARPFTRVAPIAALGLGGLAIAAGAWAAIRRRRAT